MTAPHTLLQSRERLSTVAGDLGESGPSPAPITVWAALSALGLVDLWLCHSRGLVFASSPRLVLVTLAPAGLALFYRVSGRSQRIADMAHWTVLWVVFSITGAILTYLAATRGGRLYDGLLAGVDARLGFDWTAWFDFVDRHRPLKLVLALAYASLMPQILGSVFYFAYRGWDRRNRELLLTVIISLLLTVIVFALFPALGPCTEVAVFYDLYLRDLIGLHDHVLSSFDIVQIRGVIAFPSFHAALAIVFSYAHRCTRIALPVAALNGVMLVSIPSEGGHYLIDVVAGVAIALVAIVAIRRAQPPRIGMARTTPA